MKRIAISVALCIATIAPGAHADDDFVFSNDFETGDTMCWSSTTEMRAAVLGTFLLAATACHEVESVTPDPAPAGSDITITGTNFGASQGSSTVVYDGDELAIVSWSTTEIVATLPFPKNNGVYDLDVNVRDTVTVSHEIGFGLVEIDLDALYDVKNLADVKLPGDGNAYFFVSLQDFSPMVVTYDLGTRTVTDTLVLEPLPGGFAGPALRLSPSATYATGLGLPGVAWNLVTGGTRIDVAGGEDAAEVNDATDSGLFAVQDFPVGGAWRLQEFGGREDLQPLPGAFGGRYAQALLADGTALGIGNEPPALGGVTALVWPPASNVPFDVAGERICSADRSGHVGGGTSTSVLDPTMAIWETTAFAMTEILDRASSPAEGEICSIASDADSGLGLGGTLDKTSGANDPGEGNLAFTSPATTGWIAPSATGDAWLQDNLGIVPNGATTKFVVDIQPDGALVAIGASDEFEEVGIDRVFIMDASMILDALAGE